MDLEMLLSKKQESDNLDVKLKFYDKSKYYDLVKDMISFANCIAPGDKYIAFGIENTTFNVCGITDDLPDISNLQQIINTYVEPTIHFSIGNKMIEGKKIGYIQIFDSADEKPYIIKKEYKLLGVDKLRRGEIYIRKNATNHIANRIDIDCMYEEKNKLTVKINDIIKLTDDKFTHKVNIILKNNCLNEVKIKKIQIKMVLSEKEFIIEDCFINRNTENKVYCLDKEHSIIIKAKSSLYQNLRYKINKTLIDIMTQDNITSMFLILIDDQNRENYIEIDKIFYKEFS